MKFVKGMVLGITLGTVAGMVIGATNCDNIYNVMRAGKKEVKRFKRKYCS